MKFIKTQTEIVSYVFFVLVVISVSSIIIYYFWSISNSIVKNVNRINLYSMLNIIESPIIVLNSVCSFCRFEYYLQTNFIQPQRYLFIVIGNSTTSIINYEEVYSNSIISSNLLNYTSLFSINISASTSKKINFEINSIEKNIIIENR
ncbi:MAG: hypothetical protein QXL97_00060 [Candidatus Aenigmatarchaeota archaeon]